MKLNRITIALLLVICTTLICSCSNRKRVPVIQNNQQPPTTAKPINTNSSKPGHDYSKDIRAELTDTELLITDPNSSYTIKYNIIDEIEYMTRFDYSADTLIDGTDSEYEVCAKMKNADGQEYLLSIYKTTPVYISVTYAGQTYVFNVDGAKDTKALYDSLKNKLG